MNVEHLYEKMRLIREFETAVLDMFGRGELRGTTHTCIGQEANAVGVISHLRKTDFVVSNHRSHGHYLALTEDADGLMAELMGKKSGPSSGLGGSQHILTSNFLSNGILGGTTPIAAGLAMAAKLDDSDDIVMACVGDGTFGEGVVYETLNMSSLWDLPLLFLVENNLYAQSTSVETNMAGTIADRFRAFGIDTTEVSTTDVRVLYEAGKEVVDFVRTSRRPHALIINTYRLAPHSKGDDFRDPAEIESYARLDPLSVIEAELESDVIESTTRSTQAVIKQAIEKAHADTELPTANWLGKR